MFILSQVSKLGVVSCLAVLTLTAQEATSPVNLRATETQAQSTTDSHLQTQPEARKAPARVAEYVLGPDDQIIIHAFNAAEISDRPIQITGDGYINLALVGRVKAAGVSVSGLEQELTARLANYVRDPQVTVLVSEFRSQPVSVVGAVNTPGVVQLRGRKNLVEVIALAGGLKPEAGNTVTITRELSKGRVPLPGATDDPSGQFSVAHVNLHSIMEAHNPQDNIVVETNDVVMIPRARLLYVVGEVQKPGGYVLSERDSVTVLQAVALAGGLTSLASPKKAKILHQGGDQLTRTELPTNVNKILNGQAADVELRADDILFVPSNLPKSAGTKALQTAINMAGVAVWKF
jgi:polysaccharide export outer membrane protein